MFTGLMLTSRVDSLGVGYVTYGAGVGIAAACGYVPMVATVGGWFVQQRALAVGLAVAGHRCRHHGDVAAVGRDDRPVRLA